MALVFFENIINDFLKAYVVKYILQSLLAAKNNRAKFLQSPNAKFY